MMLLLGDCREQMKALADCSVDSVVTDPPYELGFMGKSWDATGIAYDVSVWRECLRVLKPGGHLLAFGGSRTYHRLACAVEDAGFEIRDQIMWVYGSGFPKSLDVSKAIDKAGGVDVPEGKAFNRVGRGERADEFDTNGRTRVSFSPQSDAAKQWSGWGTALKPAHEPIVVARKPLSESTVAQNVLKHGTGGINVDGCRVEASDGTTTARKPYLVAETSAPFGKGVAMRGNGSSIGRWPANLIHSGEEEVVERFPNTKGSSGSFKAEDCDEGSGSTPFTRGDFIGRNDSGSAARFFKSCPLDEGEGRSFEYCAKASKSDRDEGLEDFASSARPTMGSGIGGQPDQQRANNKNNHPTVKPTSLMRYLCRLVTPPNGTVLDPFLGSGSTGKAAILEGFDFIGIELDESYMKIVEARIAAAQKEKAFDPPPPAWYHGGTEALSLGGPTLRIEASRKGLN